MDEVVSQLTGEVAVEVRVNSEPSFGSGKVIADVAQYDRDLILEDPDSKVRALEEAVATVRRENKKLLDENRQLKEVGSPADQGSIRALERKLEREKEQKEKLMEEIRSLKKGSPSSPADDGALETDKIVIPPAFAGLIKP